MCASVLCTLYFILVSLTNFERGVGTVLDHGKLSRQFLRHSASSARQLSFVPQRPAHESRDFDLARSPDREISRDRYEIESVIKLVIGAGSVLWSARALSTAKETALEL